MSELSELVAEQNLKIAIFADTMINYQNQVNELEYKNGKLLLKYDALADESDHQRKVIDDLNVNLKAAELKLKQFLIGLEMQNIDKMLDQSEQSFYGIGCLFADKIKAIKATEVKLERLTEVLEILEHCALSEQAYGIVKNTLKELNLLTGKED